MEIIKSIIDDRDVRPELANLSELTDQINDASPSDSEQDRGPAVENVTLDDPFGPGDRVCTAKDGNCLMTHDFKKKEKLIELVHMKWKNTLNPKDQFLMPT